MSPSQNGSDCGSSSIVIAVADISQVGEARRAGAAMARRFGFAETLEGKVALVVTEVASNLLKHAGHGQVLLRGLEERDQLGIEILALDQGPGMGDLDRCLRDGFSTAGSPGTGLGAITRVSDLVEVYTLPQGGTALLSQLWARPKDSGVPEMGGQSPGGGVALRASSLQAEHVDSVGAVHLPKPGESVCGDAWALDERDDRRVLLVADGLGHGPDAAAASGEAVRIFREHAQQEPGEILTRIHGALRGTRGAAVGIARLNLAKKSLRFAGAGNIAGTILTNGASRSLVSHNGIVGHELRKVQEFDYPIQPGALLVMHSDGLATQWRLDKYPGLASRHPSLIAGVLYRDFCRGRDDVTVVAMPVPELSQSPQHEPGLGLGGVDR